VLLGLINGKFGGSCGYRKVREFAGKAMELEIGIDE
jgi:hypothetical protein